MADALDSKSGVSDGVRVRVPPPVPIEFKALAKLFASAFFVFVEFWILLYGLFQIRPIELRNFC